MRTVLTSIILGSLLATLTLAQRRHPYPVQDGRKNNPCAPALAFVITGGSQFGVVNLRTGEFIAIGPGTPPDVGGGLVEAPGRSSPKHRSERSLLTLSFSGNLDSIDPVTGETTVAGATGLHDCSSPGSFDANCANTIGRHDNRLFATDFANNLYAVDPLTAKASLIGPTSIPAIPFALDETHVYDESLFSAGGKLYANFAAAVLNLNADGSFAGAPDILIQPTLYEINPRTGKAKQIASLMTADGDPALGLTTLVDLKGTVYGFDTATGQVITLDVTNGQVNPVTDLDASAGLIAGATPARSVPAIEH